MTGPTPRLLRTTFVALALTGLATGCSRGAAHTGSAATTTGAAAAVTASPTAPAPAPGSTPGSAPVPSTASQMAAVETDLAQIDAANDQSDGDFTAGVSAQSQSDMP